MKSLIASVALIAVASCTSYPTILDKKLTNTETKYRQDGTIESVNISEHTPDTLAQQSISNASPSGQVIKGCTFNLADLEETAQVAFGAARTPNPCLVASSNAGYFDAEIVDAQVQGAIIDDALGATVIGLAIKTAGGVAKAGINKAGDDYQTGNISQVTNVSEELAAASSGEAGEGGFGGSGSGDDGAGGSGGSGGEAAPGGSATGGGGAIGNNAVNIGPAAASSIAGVDAVSATGTKSGNEFIDDRDGINSSDVDAAVDVSFPLSQ